VLLRSPFIYFRTPYRHKRTSKCTILPEKKYFQINNRIDAGLNFFFMLIPFTCNRIVLQHRYFLYIKKNIPKSIFISKKNIM
jgi:hypothetical protein